jgi:DNA-binding MarR family transcriptional regulator
MTKELADPDLALNAPTGLDPASDSSTAAGPIAEPSAAGSPPPDRENAPQPADSSGERTLQEQAARLEQMMPRVMRRLFASEGEPPVDELPIAQLRVCSVLQSGPRTMTSLGEELGTSLSAVTQIADRLERADLIERVCGRDDRRQKTLRLTASGTRLMQQRRARRVERAAAALGRLSPVERARVLEAFQALLESALLAPSEDAEGHEATPGHDCAHRARAESNS